MNENLFQRRYHIDSARLSDYDYGSNGMYFITICTRNRESYFGDIVPAPVLTESILKPTPIGQVAIDCWNEIPDHFPFVQLDAFQVMPNHLHGILWICKSDYNEWQPNQFGPQRQNIASVIRGYKVGVKKQATINQIEFAWQPRYYDRVIRNLNELDRIRTYIERNPDQWADNQNNPENLYM